MKKNIEKTLDDRKYSPLVKREILRDIFGYQDGETVKRERLQQKIVKPET